MLNRFAGGLNDIKKCNLPHNLGGERGLGDCTIGYSFVDKEKGIQGTLLEEMQILKNVYL